MTLKVLHVKHIGKNRNYTMVLIGRVNLIQFCICGGFCCYLNPHLTCEFNGCVLQCSILLGRML